ncbi:MAG: helix-turn-helix domain-containing protein [Saprospiraceae bacterium]|nr:helix-turn-helix domain-containing protein [Saprospiraceae bacterium]
MLNEDKIIRLIFGFKVHYLRRQKGYSYQELADLTRLSTSYLNDIEKGKRYPKPDKVSVLAEALGVDYNYMVSTDASKKLQPIIDLLKSSFFRLFPLNDFGLSLEKLLELFTQTPDKVNAFISTIFRIARNYQIDEKKFYLEALRSYQDMHNNYFGDIEEASRAFKSEFSIEEPLPFTSSFLEDQLLELYGIKVNKKKLPQNKELKSVRSYFDINQKILYLQGNLSEAQVNFLLARELGFQFLELKERPFETKIIHIDTFEKLLNNYKASHFAAALLMDEYSLVEDIKMVARKNTWYPMDMIALLKKYNVTAETFMQRLTNILPHHFGIEDLFFIRLAENKNKETYEMTKDLHLTNPQSPYNNELGEHYCHRWVSITSINELKKFKRKSYIADAQISKYWNSDKEYLCISLARSSHDNSDRGVSVTLGLLVNPLLKGIFYFLSDPKLKYREVHTTCERCGIKDCEQRVAPAKIIEAQKEQEDRIEALNNL